jgi:hypothetical protein
MPLTTHIVKSSNATYELIVDVIRIIHQGFDAHSLVGINQKQ